MARTFIRQDAQIASTLTSIVGFVDNTAPAATMESGAANIADDLNNLRSMVSYFNDLQTGNWYDPFTASTAFGDTASIRGIQTISDNLYSIERQRVLKRVRNVGQDVAGGATQVVTLGTGDLPSNTTAAVGAVNTVGTVVAAATTFGTASATDIVAGANALQPKNLVRIFDGATGDVFQDGSGRDIYGLLQSENAVDGHTITDTASNRVQISFVVRNATNDGLQLITAGEMNGNTFDYAHVERFAFQGVPEECWLGDDNFADTALANNDRQTGYDNQGTTPVDLTTNATLDLEGAGLVWSIRDDLEASLFSIVEGSAGGTSQFNIHADVDEYDNDAAVNDFANGATIGSSNTRPITVGVTDGVIESTAGDLRVNATVELFLDDGNQTGSTWAQTDGIKLSETTTEWDDFETAFGEVSLLAAMVDAKNSTVRTKVQATLTADVSSSTDINGPGTAHNNTDVDLAPFDTVTFNTDVDVFLNGELQRHTDDVIAGGTPADGDLQFTFDLKGTGSKPDQLTIIVYGQ